MMGSTINEAAERPAPCPFCGGAVSVASNMDWHTLVANHAADCFFDPEEEMAVVPATDECLAQIIGFWNRRVTQRAEPAPSAQETAMQALADQAQELGLYDAPASADSAAACIAPWQDRMVAHYNQGKSVRMHPESHFMQQEIADWRASAATIKNSLTVAGASTDHAPKFDEAEFAAMVEKGTAAWKDVPANWLEKLRGADSAADARAQRLLKAAKTYADNYLRDQLADARDCVDSETQHSEVCELFAAIAAIQTKEA